MKTTWAILAALVLGAAVSSARAAQYSIMALTAPPTLEATDGPGVSYELGTKFQSDVAGQILALRYWQPALETGSHLGNLWTSSGTLLESVAFSNEAAGWMQATLATPVNIQAGSIYVVSVNANVYYADTDFGLSNSLVNGPIHTIADNDNGVFSQPPDTFPTDVFNNTNYYRDVVFQPAVVPEPATIGMLALGGVLLVRRRRGVK